MRLIVTGCEGQLVRCLIEQADAGEFDLVAVGRPDVDLAVPGQLAAAIRDLRPDLVINAAAYTAVDQAESEPDLAFRINADAAGEAAAAARLAGAPIIQLSTDYVFDGLASEPIGEDRPTSPINIYGRSKLGGEDKVRSGNPDHMILRTAWVYSPFGRNFVRSILSAAAARPELTVVADQRGSPTSALDLAAAILHSARLIRAGKEGLLGKTFHVAGSGEASWAEVAEAVMTHARELGIPAASVRRVGTEDWPTAARRPAYSVLDSRRFTEATGFVMPHWRKSLAAVVKRLASTAS